MSNVHKVSIINVLAKRSSHGNEVSQKYAYNIVLIISSLFHGVQRSWYVCVHVKYFINVSLRQEWQTHIPEPPFRIIK